MYVYVLDISVQIFAHEWTVVYHNPKLICQVVSLFLITSQESHVICMRFFVCNSTWQ